MGGELDQEVLDALEEFMGGEITLAELKTIIGPDAFAEIQQKQQDETNPDSFFDDPESF